MLCQIKSIKHSSLDETKNDHQNNSKASIDRCKKETFNTTRQLGQVWVLENEAIYLKLGPITRCNI
jgi:hypothetical protein